MNAGTTMDEERFLILNSIVLKKMGTAAAVARRASRPARTARARRRGVPVPTSRIDIIAPLRPS